MRGESHSWKGGNPENLALSYQRGAATAFPSTAGGKETPAPSPQQQLPIRRWQRHWAWKLRGPKGHEGGSGGGSPRFGSTDPSDPGTKLT